MEEEAAGRIDAGGECQESRPCERTRDLSVAFDQRHSVALQLCPPPAEEIGNTLRARSYPSARRIRHGTRPARKEVLKVPVSEHGNHEQRDNWKRNEIPTRMRTTRHRRRITASALVRLLSFTLIGHRQLKIVKR